MAGLTCLPIHCPVRLSKNAASSSAAAGVPTAAKKHKKRKQNKKQQKQPLVRKKFTTENPISIRRSSSKPTVQEVDITLLSPSGDSFDIRMSDCEEVEAVKERVEEVTGIPTFRQELHDGSETDDFLKDTAAVADLTTEDGSKLLLHLIAKPAPPVKPISTVEMAKFSLLMIRGLEVYVPGSSLLSRSGTKRLLVLHLDQSLQFLRFSKRKDGRWCKYSFNVHTDITQIKSCPDRGTTFEIRTNLRDRKGRAQVVQIELPTEKSRDILVTKLCNLIHYIKVKAAELELSDAELTTPFPTIPRYVEDILNEQQDEPIYETEGGYV